MTFLTLAPCTSSFSDIPSCQIPQRRTSFVSLHDSQKSIGRSYSRRYSKSTSDSRFSNGDSISIDSLEQQQLYLKIKEAEIGDYWGISDTHCSAFLPDLIFPMDSFLRLDRFLAMFGSSLLPTGCERKWLVAVASHRCKSCLGHDEIPVRECLLHWKTLEDGYRDSSKIESILGALMVDTVAEFLPKRKLTPKRRSGIAYISNLAVRKKARRKGIAMSLIQEAEKIATTWGCRSIALHCDKNNPAALGLYARAGYKVVKIPANAKWPQPKAISGSEFCLMMKCLGFS